MFFLKKIIRFEKIYYVKQMFVNVKLMECPIVWYATKAFFYVYRVFAVYRFVASFLSWYIISV